MLDFENKPIKDWTLAECKDYCLSRRNEYNTYCFDNDCLLRIHNICAYEPRNYKISSSLLKFTPDEIAYCRLVKETYPWANYITRNKFNDLKFIELFPRFDESGRNKIGTTGRFITIQLDFFPQIKPLTYYAIDDIIEQRRK